jgi:hypothetical protein
MFRDQSASVVQRVQRGQRSEPIVSQNKSPKLNHLEASVISASSRRLPNSLCYTLEASGAAFFFAQYTIFNEPPFTGTFHDWVLKSYSTSDPNCSLRLVIEAVGMAGLGNGFLAPNAAERSREQYCKALSAVNKALNDPARAYDDSTLLTIVLLGVYEVSHPLVLSFLS